MELISRSSREPLGFKAATLARPQTAHRAVEFGFEIVRAGIGIGAERWNSITVQTNFRTVGPEDNRSLSGIRPALVIFKTLDHSVLARAINDRQPAFRRVEP